MRCTYLPNLLNGRGEYVEDDHPLLRRRPIRHFHQDDIRVNHQEAQVEELEGEAQPQHSFNVLHIKEEDPCLYFLQRSEESTGQSEQRDKATCCSLALFGDKFSWGL